MDRSHARATTSTTVWLFGALVCAAGFVVVMLLLSSKPAGALDLPPVGSVVQDPVGTVTKTVTDAVTVAQPSSEPAPADPKPAASQPATGAPSLLAPVTAVTEPVTDVAERATTPIAHVVDQVTPPLAGALAPVTDTIDNVVSPAAQRVLAPVAGIVDDITPPLAGALVPVTDTIDNVVSPAAQRVLAPVAGIVDDITPPLAGALAPVTDTIDNVVSPAAQRVLAPVAGIVDDLTPPPPSRPEVPDLGGTVRRLTAPTAAPLPLNSDPPQSASPPAPPITATGTDAFGSGIGAAGVTRAPGARTATVPPAPRDGIPFDMPSGAPPAPAAPAGTSGPADGGRAPTLLLNFAIVLAAAALALVASRLVALYQRLPRTQFLTVLIERPG